MLPADVVVAKEVTRGAEHKTVPAEKIPASWSIVDIGKQSLASIEAALPRPDGVLERAARRLRDPDIRDGTRAMARFLAGRAERARRSSSAAATRSPRSSSRASPTR